MPPIFFFRAADVTDDRAVGDRAATADIAEQAEVVVAVYREVADSFAVAVERAFELGCFGADGREVALTFFRRIKSDVGGELELVIRAVVA